MNHQNTHTTDAVVYTDVVARDFYRAVITVSLLANLTVFVTWLTLLVA